MVPYGIPFIVHHLILLDTPFISPQVYHSEGPGHSYRWNKRCCGVVCFVKDNLKRSYFIRVFDMDNHLLVFEQEIYNQLK